MAYTDSTFFYTARSLGINSVVVSLAKYPALDWHGRQAILAAEAEHEQLWLYELDLLWMLTKCRYEGNLPQPSSLVKRGYNKPKEPRTAAEIIDHVIKGLESCTTARVVKGSEIFGTYDPNGKVGA